SEDSADDIYAYITQKGASLLITNSAKIYQRKRLRLYKNAMLAGKKGIKTFILDENGDGREYSECISLAVEESGLCPSDAGASYITMPAFSDVCAEFEAKGMIRGAEEYGILKGMPFMGFIGLNRAVTSFVAGENWKYSGERASKDNEALALKYLSTLPAPHLFIDSGWGNFSAGGKVSEENSGEYDLSGVPAGDMGAVTKIFSCGYSAFAKCGMIARYFAQKEVDNRGELESNIKLAVRLVFKVMRLETVPEVELREVLDNPTAGGLCCGGDKMILFRYADCKNSVWLRGSIVHECFHAMQFKLRKGGWSEWYYDSFGITRGRAERWSLTNNIYDQNTGSDLYKVHIIEADAKAFEADCADACTEAWDKLFN
ncbi:MAG: hypothetical protein K2N30_02335, partial [Clostridia bacterium]|nr:hypothetical protein [Clostridia bacterium]